MLRPAHPTLRPALPDRPGTARLPGAGGRIRTEGKFFADAGGGRFVPRGFTYGPFRPDDRGVPLPPPDRVAADLTMMADDGATCVRVYTVPPAWFLDAAADAGLRVLVGVDWEHKPEAFLERRAGAAVAKLVRSAARAVGGHAATFGLCLANEVPPTLARFVGTGKAERFLSRLADAARQEAPDTLVTFASYPPGEFLRPTGFDFDLVNLYLHDVDAFGNYLCRLHHLADGRPVVVGELGIDTSRETDEAGQAALLAGHWARARREGVAGGFVFAFTDEWFTRGYDITDWSFGVTTRDRRPKTALAAVARAFADDSALPAQLPPASVVVCTYNGSPTLGACLRSLSRLEYPEVEVLVVDDGSTDNTPQVLAEAQALFENLTVIRQANGGLSHARNVGLTAARGEVVAFTDDDCEADPRWLATLVSTMRRHGWSGAGGPNLVPDGGLVARCVARAPGGPAHVMADDRVADHVPGCNMAFERSAASAVGGFDPQFRSAGDDVDFIWRLQEAGHVIGFAAGAQVWHHRRSTVGAYFTQQRGYGAAEADLATKHPGRFSRWLGARWPGRIYGTGSARPRGRVRHGVMGTGAFQLVYASPASAFRTLATLAAGPEGTTAVLALLTAGPLVGGGGWAAAWATAAGIVLLGLLGAVAHAAGPPVVDGPLLRRAAARLLVTWLAWRQPWVRGVARWRRRWQTKHAPRVPPPGGGAAWFTRGLSGGELRFWVPVTRAGRIDAQTLRLRVLTDAAASSGARVDPGWTDTAGGSGRSWDLEWAGRLAKVRATAVGVDYAEGLLVRVRLRFCPTTFCLLVAGVLSGLVAGVGVPPVAIFFASTATLLAWWVSSVRLLAACARHVKAAACRAGCDAVVRRRDADSAPASPAAGEGPGRSS